MAPVKRRINDSLKVTQLSVAELSSEPVAPQDWLTGWRVHFSSGPTASADTTALGGKELFIQLGSRGQPVHAHLGDRCPDGRVRPCR